MEELWRLVKMEGVEESVFQRKMDKTLARIRKIYDDVPDMAILPEAKAVGYHQRLKC
jgi:hypothetical protein